MVKFILCTIEGCGRSHWARGFCSVHYGRWRHHGDPLGGGTGHGEPLRYLEEEVLAYEGDECLIWPYARTGSGYAHIWHEGKDQLVHRLVCEEENGPPPSPDHEVAHSCGKGHEGCVNRHHLDWKTRPENFADKLIHGTHNRGERHPMAILTVPDVREIRRLGCDATTEEANELAQRFGVSRGTIRCVAAKKTWAWLQ